MDAYDLPPSPCYPKMSLAGSVVNRHGLSVIIRASLRVMRDAIGIVEDRSARDGFIGANSTNVGGIHGSSRKQRMVLR